MNHSLESKWHVGRCYVWIAALFSPTFTLSFYGLGRYADFHELYRCVLISWQLMGIMYLATPLVGAAVFAKAKKGCETCWVARFIVVLSWLAWLPLLIWLFPTWFPILIHLLGGGR